MLGLQIVAHAALAFSARSASTITRHVAARVLGLGALPGLPHPRRRLGQRSEGVEAGEHRSEDLAVDREQQLATRALGICRA